MRMEDGGKKGKNKEQQGKAQKQESYTNRNRPTVIVTTLSTILG